MKKLYAILIAAFLSMQLLVPVSVASSFDYLDTLNDFQEGVEEQSEELEDNTEAIVLPNYQETFDEDGTSGIVNTIQTALDFAKLIMAPIAVLVIVVMGVRMVAAGRENENVTTQAKSFITYAVEGLIVIFLADAIVDVTFGTEGQIFREGEAGAQQFGQSTSTLLQGVYSLIQVIIASIAVLMLVIAGLRYVGGSYSDDQIAGAKRMITWSLVGLFVVGVSEFVVKEILFQDEGAALGVDEANQLFAQVTNFIAGTVGTLAFVFILYAGMLYVSARDNDDQVSKAKKILVGALIGILLAAAAFAITNTIVELDASR